MRTALMRTARWALVGVGESCDEADNVARRSLDCAETVWSEAYGSGGKNNGGNVMDIEIDTCASDRVSDHGLD